MADEKVQLPTPRRLSDFPGNHTQTFHGAILAKQPIIAVGVAVTIAHMAAVDSVYDQMLVYLLGAEGNSVSTVLRSIRSNPEKLRLTSRLIEAKLQDDHLKLFRLINNEIAPIRDIRNQFAHGLWGETPSLPESLLLGESQPFNNLIGASIEAFAKEGPLQRAKNFLFDLMMAENDKKRLNEEERIEVTTILSEMTKNTGDHKIWPLLFESNEPKQFSNPQVWEKSDISLATNAAMAAYLTVAAFSSCVGPMAQEVAPLLAKVQSGGLLLQAHHINHSRNDL